MKTLPIVCIMTALPLLVPGQQLPAQEAQMIRRIEMIADSIKPHYFEDWSDLIMSMIIVDQNHEYLINAPGSDKFQGTVIQDPILNRPIQYRPTSFNTNLSATFPATGEGPIIVMGKIKNTPFDKSRWMWTLLHEHFHQLQMVHPYYTHASRALGLAKDENDHMWPLNYPFPYDKPAVITQIQRMANILLQFWEQTDRSLLVDYIAAKHKLKSLVSTKDYLYLNFQFWQEGIPRFLEYDMLSLWMGTHQDEELTKLLSQYEAEFVSNLRDIQLPQRGRIAFYSLGALEAHLINSTNPAWRSQYFATLFDTDHMLRP